LRQNIYKFETRFIDIFFIGIDIVNGQLALEIL